MSKWGIYNKKDELKRIFSEEGQAKLALSKLDEGHYIKKEKDKDGRYKV